MKTRKKLVMVKLMKVIQNYRMFFPCNVNLIYICGIAALPSLPPEFLFVIFFEGFLSVIFNP